MEVPDTLLDKVNAVAGEQVYVGVDVGGTNARVVMGIPASYVELCKFTHSKSTRTLVSSLSQLSSLVKGKLKKKIGGGTIAAAGRVLEGGALVEFTNFEGGEAEKVLKKSELDAFLFPATNSHIINDLQSCCFGLVALHHTRELPAYFQPVWGSSSASLSNHNYLVMAMGTGLGVALILSLPSTSQYHVLPMEGGHMLIPPLGSAHAQNKEERALVEAIAAKVYKSEHTLEWEDICSGRGLCASYEHFSHDGTCGEVAGIAKKALTEEEEGPNRKALLQVYKFLARASQDLAVGTQVKGVFWAGDNQETNKDFIFKHSEELKAAFLNHPKQAWIQSIPILSQVKSLNTNLVGALYFASQAQH